MVRPKTKRREGTGPTTANTRMRAEAALVVAVGMSGKCKHHFMRSMLLGTQMGKHGFVRLPLSEKMEVVNVGVLDQMAGTEGTIDLGEMKVLGSGMVNRKLVVNAAGFSAMAKSKIEAAGGQAVVV